jgi:hypothetical protein
MIIKLKPQWLLKSTGVGEALLVSENVKHVEPLDRQKFLDRLVVGIDVTDLDDDEMELLEAYNARGFLAFDPHPSMAGWELHGAAWADVQEQLKHVTYNFIDLTKNSVGQLVADGLEENGMYPADDAKLTLVFADSYLDLPDMPGKTYLPVICNRMRLWLGPMCFPWTKLNVRTFVRLNESYLDTANYSLPLAFHNLQVAWLITALLQLVALNHSRYVGSFVELNMLKMKTVIHPF